MRQLSVDVIEIPRLSEHMRLRAFVVTSAITLLWLAGFLWNSLTSRLVVIELAGAYSLPIVLTILGSQLRSLRYQEPGGQPARGRAWIGIGLISGAAAFDLFATVLHSPGLELEANPTLRALLDTGHSLTTVYIYAAVTNAIVVWMMCEAWVVCGRQQRRIADFAGPHAQSWWRYLKAATGGAGLTWREWLLPLTPRELPNLYFWIWPVLGITVSTTTLFRMYAGCEWFEWVPLSPWTRGVALAAAVVVPLGGWWCGLYAEYRRCRQQIAVRP